MKIRGDRTNLFSHCVAIGLAAILQNEGKRVKLWWPDRNHIRVETDDGMDDEDIGNSVVSYAQNIAGSDWLQFEDQWGEEKASDEHKYSPLSPRVYTGINKKGEVVGGFALHPKRYGKLRQEKLDEALEDGCLVRGTFLAIGRAAYWSNRKSAKSMTKSQTDGASPWIMFSTSQGADYMRKYYRVICEKIASFDSDESSEVQDSLADKRLRGERVLDEFKKEKGVEKKKKQKKKGGKTGETKWLYSHGLCESGREIDTLQLWCALHAFGCFSTRPVVSGRADESSPSNCLGFFKHEGKEYFCLPVFDKPVYFERFKSILRSADLYRFCTRQLGSSDSSRPGEGSATDGGKRLGIQCAYIFERLQNSEMKSNTLHYAAEGRRVQ